MKGINAGPMLNAYPDSMGGRLGNIVDLLKRPEFKGVFSSFYILPSIFNTDLDRGFSVIDYSLNPLLADEKELADLKALGIDLKLDFILNHASVLSPQFQDILKYGEQSKYKDFFIDWNQFWNGCGEMTAKGYIQPHGELLANMFFRKPGLPFLMVRFPDGRDVPYWNTFYQEVRYTVPDVQDIMQRLEVPYAVAARLSESFSKAIADGEKPENVLTEDAMLAPSARRLAQWLESERKYLGQMDLNIKSPLVWEFYKSTLTKLAKYGAQIIRLDAFAYAPKAPGEKNFLNDPGTWDLLENIRELAQPGGMRLLPEIHASYEEKIYSRVAQEGYMIYDFFLPGLIIDGLERGETQLLAMWARELYERKIMAVNMLGCHDGIPVLDLKGLLPEERIQKLLELIVSRGGHVKDLHGQKNVYYQVNATYYSALGEDDKKMLLARALQLFMPGKPQIWYLDLFVGKNDYDAVRRAGPGGHKEINRTNLTVEEIEAALTKPVVRRQLEMLRFRNLCPAFGFGSKMEIDASESVLKIVWRREAGWAKLEAHLKSCEFCMQGTYPDGTFFLQEGYFNAGKEIKLMADASRKYAAEGALLASGRGYG